MLIVKLKEEKKELLKIINQLNEEVVQQTKEQNDAKEVLVETKSEVEKIEKSKKEVIQHLHKVIQ